jgi:hypothetical protein
VGGELRVAARAERDHLFGGAQRPLRLDAVILDADVVLALPVAEHTGHERVGVLAALEGQLNVCVADAAPPHPLVGSGWRIDRPYQG